MARLVREHEDGKLRCSWAWPDQIYIDYHDKEWGRELRGQNEMFERLSLEAFQAGLSWITILKRREAFRDAFQYFDPEVVANFSDAKVSDLLNDARIIRNKPKILAVIHNARVTLEKRLDLSQLLWSHEPKHRLTSTEDFKWLAVSQESQSLSRELRALGFKFVGPTTMYALMQSIGMVEDHAPDCFLRA